jgi:DNA polymerase-3 subunit delta'
MTTPLPWHETAYGRLLRQRARLPHALLLHGRRGIGKLRFALAVAEALLCERPLEGGSCGGCAACAWTTSGTHPDLRRVEPAAEAELEAEQETRRGKASTQIVIEQIRGLADFLFIGAHRGGWRIVLVNPAEGLNMSAANALLKNLEEPPPQTLFLLVSHRLHALLPTIKSRCQLLPLPSPTVDEATQWLEAQGIEDAALAAAYTGQAPLLAIDLPVEDYWPQRKRFLDHLATEFDALSVAERSADAGIPLLLEWMQKWTYDLATRNILGKVRYNVDFEKAIAPLAGVCDPIRTLRFHRDVLRQQRHAEHPLNARLFLEHMLLSYADLIERRRVPA